MLNLTQNPIKNLFFKNKLITFAQKYEIKFKF